MDDRENTIELFRQYGFEYRPQASSNEFFAFTYKSGFFHNAELVSISEGKNSEIEAKMEKASQDLEKLGFSVKKTFYSSYQEIEETLFNGFFNVMEWKEKIKSEYTDHSKRILSVLPDGATKYSYINVPYLKNNISSENSIVEDISGMLIEKGPSLTIIEAPAGFGKTCTSYEIIKFLVDKKNNPIPFFTEFSRDRQARVFNHIFVREVDRSFSSVNSEVVIKEVKKGRIAVVLDGFDELLHDSKTTAGPEDGFETTEPMLETISELLTDNAKIILTSRRSAIFDGEKFNEWIGKYEDKFTVNRYRLKVPNINDWIPYSRLSRLDATSINVSKLSNPVLLSFLRFVDDDYFEKLCEEPSKIVEQYFQSMLEREMDRQELRMSPLQQSNFLTVIASDMCEHNYTSDSKDKIIELIKEKCFGILSEVRSLYSPVDKPTIDKLASKLSNHAFFDKSNQKENNIEFVNEFVFGNYIANNAIKIGSSWMASDERFVEPAVLSYSPRDRESRLLLWDSLSSMTEFLDSSLKMKNQSILTGAIDGYGYDNSDISSISVRGISLFEMGGITNSVVKDCSFTECKFYFDHFNDVTFLNCKFWNCEFTKIGDTELAFYNCKDDNGFVDDVENLDLSLDIERDTPADIYVLEKIFPVGNNSIKRLHYFTANLFKTSDYSRKEISKAVKFLKREGYLLDANDANFVAINKSKINEIKVMLGRDK
ncbi:MAG: hypothetical protein KJ914_05840 [Gammaproteobacteria bacterium]|nr:hypothetical protein [Gammaproteobacteria bacterium]